MQSTPSLETFFSRIFHHYPNLHLALCTSHHWMDIRKVCYLSVSWYTLLHLPEMPKTSCPQISSSNTTSFLLPSIHSFSLFLGQIVIKQLQAFSRFFKNGGHTKQKRWFFPLLELRFYWGRQSVNKYMFRSGHDKFCEEWWSLKE